MADGVTPGETNASGCDGLEKVDAMGISIAKEERRAIMADGGRSSF